MCEPAWKGALLGSCGLWGMLLTLPILPPLADKYGRKKFFIAGRLIESVLYTVVMTTESWAVMLCVMMGFGLCSTTRITIGLTYLLELFPSKAQTRTVVINFTEATAIYASYTVYMWMFGKNWFDFVMVGYILCLLTVCMSFFIPDSPRLLFSQGRIEEGKRALDFIVKVNCKPAIDWSKIDLSICTDETVRKAQNLFHPMNVYPTAMLYHIQINVPLETDLPAMHNLLKRQGSSFISLDETSGQLKSTNRSTDSRALSDTKRSFFYKTQRSFTVSFDDKN